MADAAHQLALALWAIVAAAARHYYPFDARAAHQARLARSLVNAML